MKYLIDVPKKLALVAASLLLVVGLAIPVVVPQQAHAAQLTSRSLTISSSANGTITTDAGGNAVVAGQGGNGQKTTEVANFTMSTSGATIGSMIVMYCNSPIPQSGTCTTPTGFTAANVTSISTAGSTGLTGGFSIDTTTADPSNSQGICNGGGTVRTNCVLLKAGSPQVQSGTPTIKLTIGSGASDYITNPTTDNYSFYARIAVYSDTAYTTLVDYGSVAASTAQQVDITAKVQEVLNFSVGTTVTSPGGTACTPFSDTGALVLGDPVNGVLSIAQAYDAHSYFRVSTNTLHGTIVYYSGNTLTSGGNSITAAGTSAVSSTVGAKQFGLGLDSSDTQGGSGYSFTDLTATPPYNQGNGTITNGGTAKFAFDTTSTTTPVQIASSSGGITCDTGSVRYIGNISTATPAGIYTTTITYIATGTY